MKSIFNILIGIVILTFLSCEKKEMKFTEVDFNSYKMKVPSNWKIADAKGVDSDVIYIITGKGDTINSDFGTYSEKFNETVKVFSIEQKLKYSKMNLDTSSIVASNAPEIDESQGTFLNEYYFYKTIDSQLAKIKVPKINHNGNIGISFEQIDKSDNGLTIQGKVVDDEEQKLLLKSFETIIFTKSSIR
ncbi:MAG: hypothetical protein E2604_17700 [Flavobacterium sp.]|nr:hypothetical protein [Flavobacterium sp.]